ncbi:MAG: M1 family metallopeptidase [bacterium]|nr:M1 family metallopeptidase [bacterium]
MKYLVIAVIICLIPLCSFAVEDGSGWVTTRLDLSVTVDNISPVLDIGGTITLRLEAENSSGPVLWMNSRVAAMQWQSVTGDKVAEVSLNKTREDSPYERAAEIRLQKTAVRGEEITLHFATTKIDDVDQLISRQDISLASWVEAWYPVPRVDQTNGSEFTSRLISVPGTTSFNLPFNWVAITDGKLVSRKNEGDRTLEVWDLTDNLVARSFAAGPFQMAERKVDGRTIRIYLIQEHKMSVDRLAELLGASLKAQEARLGVFPFAGYGVVEVPDDISGWSAASQQTFIMARSSNFDHDHGNLPLWAHEMCHGWWGNTVNTTGPGSKIVSEALAQFGVIIALEALEGTEAMIEFLDFSRSGYNDRQCAKGYFGMLKNGTDHPLATLGTSDLSGGITHNLADSKGMWFYHMLRRKIGDDLFFSTLRGLIDDFAGRELSLDGLRQAFIATAPDHDLEPFFAQWLDRTGAPRIEVAWTMADNNQVQIDLKQSRDYPPFNLDLELELIGEDGSKTRETIRVSEYDTTVHLNVPAKIDEVVVDPDRDYLLWRPSYSTVPMVNGVHLQATATWLKNSVYAGKYHIEKFDMEIIIIDKDDGLYLDLGGDISQLYPDEPDQFKTSKSTIEFTVIDAQATEFVATLNSGLVVEGVRID